MLLGCSSHKRIRGLDATQLAEQIQSRHPTWKTKSGNNIFCYLLSIPRPDIVPWNKHTGDWTVPSPLCNGSVEEIRSEPFDAEAWRGVVLIRFGMKPEDRGKKGWYGPIIVKDPYLFYGEKEMLKQIDEELK